MDVLPRAKALRQVPPGHAGLITIQNRLNEQTIVRCSHAHMALLPRQQIANTLSLAITKAIASHRSALKVADPLSIELRPAPETSK